MLYRLINSGKTQRKEYYHHNRSDLFRPLPQKDLTQEQRESYEYFLYQALPKLLQFYFPAQFKDYNNQVSLEILNYENGELCRWEEPEFTKIETYRKKTTWSQKLFLT